MKYLIFNMTGIGDLYWVYPYCKAIKDYDKDAYIVLYSGADANARQIETRRSMLDILDAIDEVDYYNKREPFHTILFLIKSKMKHFDYSFCILDYETGGVGRACARIAVEMGKVSIGLEQRNLPNINFTITLKRDKKIRNRRHYYAEMLKAIGTPPPSLDGNLECIDYHKLSRYLNAVGIDFNREKKYIAIAIGAGYGAYVDNGIYHYIDIKNWKVERWILLANSLEKDGFTPILIGGNAEKEKLAEKGIDISDGVINLVGKTSIGESLAVVSKCSLLISADTGHIHGAYLVNTPVLGLFGSTDPSVIFPYNNKNRVLFSHENCSPCWNDNEKKKQCKSVKCLDNITVDMVRETALNMLK